MDANEKAEQAASASASAPLQRGLVTKPIQPVERSLQQRIKKDHNTFLADPFNEAAPSQGESNKSWPRLRPITSFAKVRLEKKASRALHNFTDDQITPEESKKHAQSLRLSGLGMIAS